MKPLIKFLFYLTAIAFTCLALVQFIIFLAPEVKGEEEQFNPEYHLDLTYSYEFEDATTTDITLIKKASMSAVVPESSCSWCLKYLNPSQCLTFCDVIID